MFNRMSVEAKNYSVAAGRDINAPVTISVAQIVRLGSALGKVTATFAMLANASNYQQTPKSVPAGIDVKISFNKLDAEHHLLERYKNYGFMLGASWEQVLDINSSARMLTLESLHTYYKGLLTDYKIEGVSIFMEDKSLKEGYADKILGKLFSHFSNIIIDELSEHEVSLLKEEVEFAVGLVLVDAFFECRILERP